MDEQTSDCETWFPRLVIFFLAALFANPITVLADYETPAGFDNLPTVSLSASSSGDDLTNFNDAMASLSSQGGGIILMEAGDYQMSGIDLESNIHVRMKAGVTIQQTTATNVFTIGNRTTATNVSIAGVSDSDRPLIRALQPTAANESDFRAVKVANAQNFMVSNLNIRDEQTRFSTINSAEGSNEGTIENIKMTGAGPGWGLYQVQSGQNILVRNLDGEGGFTLRLEQDNDDLPVGIQNLVAENIISRNGRAAVLVAPKSTTNGTVDITNVRSFGSQWAVLSTDGKGDGVFEQVNISNVAATFGSDDAQFRTFRQDGNVIDFVPNNLRGNVEAYDLPSKPEKFQTGPSMGVVSAELADWVSITDVEPASFPESFECQPDVINQFGVSLIRAQRSANTPLVILPGDYNTDGVVDTADLQLVENNLGNPAGSMFNDFLGTTIGDAQRQLVLQRLGATTHNCLGASSVPEPSTAILLVMSGLVVAIKRRRI